MNKQCIQYGKLQVFKKNTIPTVSLNGNLLFKDCLVMK